jgi:enamine deaminase RidA (YjgF/YER057c/UK114 family)
MKPMDLSKAQAKQSATALQMYRTEQLPGMEPMTAPGRAPTMAGGFSFFSTQVPRARAQTEELFGETTTRQTQRQRQEFTKVISPSFMVTPVSQRRQVFATEPTFTQSQKQREAQATMMSMDVMQGQRQRNVQQQATEFSFDQTTRRSQESRRRQDFVTDQFRETRQRRDIIITPSYKQTPFQEITTRQRTDQTTKQWTKETPYKEITKIIIPGGFALPSGTDTGRQRGRSKSPFRETIGIKSMFSSGAMKGVTKIKKRKMKKV